VSSKSDPAKQKTSTFNVVSKHDGVIVPGVMGTAGKNMRLPPKLEGTIPHGMWSSAATRKHVVTQGKPKCVIA
jgi:hypothetical protein